MNRHQFLAHVHRLTQPRNYLEIGVNDGRSLALATTRSIAVDPAFKVNVEIQCDVALIKATSDDFFARTDAIDRFPERVVDFAFIDGMHIFEFALRDFINVEKLAHPGTIVVLDDMLPRSNDEAARDRHTLNWAGDVYKVGLVLEKYRPDLVTIPLDTTPTGLLLVVGLDPKNTVLTDKYDEILAEFATPDPQDVPSEILNRSVAADPEKVVADPVFAQVEGARLEEKGPDFSGLRFLRGTATYQPTHFENQPWPGRRPAAARKGAAKKATKSAKASAGKPAAKAARRPTVARRFKRAVKAFLS